MRRSLSSLTITESPRRTLEVIKLYNFGIDRGNRVNLWSEDLSREVHMPESWEDLLPTHLKDIKAEFSDAHGAGTDVTFHHPT